MSSEGEQQTRDIKNHLLFEIATEVAHRGQSRLVSSRDPYQSSVRALAFTC